VEAAMSSDDKIWANGNAPATSLKATADSYTLGEAVIGRDHLAKPRKSTATIRSGGRVFTAAEPEIDRLYQKKIPTWLCSRARIISEAVLDSIANNTARRAHDLG
jgi:hypothetical protein